MKTVESFRGKDTKGLTIIFDKEPDILQAKSQEEIVEDYYNSADSIVDAMYRSLPQGMIAALTISLVRKQSAAAIYLLEKLREKGIKV